MKKLAFSIKVDAPKEKVWNTLWDDASYREWTKVFSEGSHAVTDWQEGSKVLFLAGNGEGMYSRIEKRIDNEYMSIRHLGEIKDGKEIPVNPEKQGWSNAMENYTLKEENGQTTISAEMDTTDDFVDYFKETFPKALNRIKELSEA